MEVRIIVTGARAWRDYNRLVHELAYVAKWCAGTQAATAYERRQAQAVYCPDPAGEPR